FFHPDTAQLRQPGDPARTGNSAVLGGSNNESGPAAQAVESMAPADNQPLSKPEVFSRTLNTKYHEGPVTFTKDQNVIVFTRNNGSKGKTGKSNDGIRKLKLYSAVN